jgi:hypothetical protein
MPSASGRKNHREPEVNIPKLVGDITSIDSKTPEPQRKRVMSRLIRVLKRAKYRARFLSFFGMVGASLYSYRLFFNAIVSLVEGKRMDAGMQFLAGQALQLASEAFEVAATKPEKMSFDNNYYDKLYETGKTGRMWRPIASYARKPEQIKRKRKKVSSTGPIPTKSGR